MGGRRQISVGVLLCVLCGPLVGQAQDFVVKTDDLREMPMTGLPALNVSPDGRLLAVIVPKGSRQTVRVNDVVVDGLYDRVQQFRTRENGANGVRPFLFSPNGEHYAFVGALADGEHLVVDGKAGPASDSILLTIGEDVMFSADSLHFAYVIRPLTGSGKPETIAIRGQDNRAAHVVVDGQLGAAYVGIESLQFSPDGKRVAYAGQTPGGPQSVVVDGRKLADCRKVERLSFSADSKHVGYSCIDVEPGNLGLMNARVVIDGVPNPTTYSTVSDFQWSNKDAHYGYIGVLNANRSPKPVVVVDGQEKLNGSETAAEISKLRVASDGRYACVVRRARQTFVFVDDKPSLGYDQVMQLAFSKDGKHVAATVRSANGAFLLFDQVESDLPSGSPTDGNWFFVDLPGAMYAYPKKVGNDWKLVVEGDGSSTATAINLSTQKDVASSGPSSSRLTFSRDGRHYAVPSLGAIVSSEKIPGEVTPGYAANDREPFVFSPDGKHLAFIATTTSKTGPHQTQLFVDGALMPALLAGPTVGFESIRFSQDSRHVAFLAAIKGDGSRPQSGPRQQIFIDGRPGPVVDEVIKTDRSFVSFMPDGRLLVIARTGTTMQRHVIDATTSTVAEFAANAKKSAPVDTASDQISSGAKDAKKTAEAEKEKVKSAVDGVKKGIGGLLKKKGGSD